MTTVIDRPQVQSTSMSPCPVVWPTSGPREFFKNGLTSCQQQNNMTSLSFSPMDRGVSRRLSNTVMDNTRHVSLTGHPDLSKQDYNFSRDPQSPVLKMSQGFKPLPVSPPTVLRWVRRRLHVQVRTLTTSWQSHAALIKAGMCHWFPGYSRKEGSVAGTQTGNGCSHHTMGFPVHPPPVTRHSSLTSVPDQRFFRFSSCPPDLPKLTPIARTL